jgi:hypothetical protein
MGGVVAQKNTMFVTVVDIKKIPDFFELIMYPLLVFIDGLSDGHSEISSFKNRNNIIFKDINSVAGRDKLDFISAAHSMYFCTYGYFGWINSDFTGDLPLNINKDLLGDKIIINTSPDTFPDTKTFIVPSDIIRSFDMCFKELFDSRPQLFTVVKVKSLYNDYLNSNIKVDLCIRGTNTPKAEFNH